VGKEQRVGSSAGRGRLRFNIPLVDEALPASTRDSYCSDSLSASERGIATRRPRRIPANPGDLSDSDSLDAFLDAHDRVLIQFYTDGWSICDSMPPVLDAVVQKTAVPVVTVNPRDDPPLVERFRITSVPTLVVFRDGDPVDRLADGFVPVADLTAFVTD
jgi:thiol-disulfide isomerase/thioredoxin